MKRTLLTLATFFAVTAARAADIATTFHFNASLSHEANPIVAHLGADAGTLLLTNVVGVVGLLLVPLFLYWRFPSAPMPAPPATLREFISLQLHGRLLSRGEFLRAMFLGVPLPRNGLQFARYLGIALSWTIVFASCLAVLAWWAIWGWGWHGYQKFRALFVVGGYPALELLLSIPVFAWVSWMYFRSEFSAYRHARAASA